MTIRRPVAYRFPSFFYCRVGVIQSLKSLLYDLFAAAMPVAGNLPNAMRKMRQKLPSSPLWKPMTRQRTWGSLLKFVDKEYPLFAKEKLFRRFNQSKTAE